jgi:transposase
MALVDALGNLIRFVLLPGQRHDSIGVEPLITGLDFEALIGDKAFDNNWLRANLNERGAAAVIPSKADRAGRIPHDAEMYKWRHLVENFFANLRHSAASQPATKRPMPVLPASSISSCFSLPAGDCKQALVQAPVDLALLVLSRATPDSAPKPALMRLIDKQILETPW